jgi:Ca2+/H+ antiporter, TMEM165/GDT1 family
LGYVFLAAYWTVLGAEFIGDKSIYTVTTLTLRFRSGVVLTMMTVAFAIKMLTAVALGNVLTGMPSVWAPLLSATGLFAAGAFIWFKKTEGSVESPTILNWPKAAAVAFASLLLTEWGDPGQISAAALTIQYKLPVVTWLAGTLALLTKGVLAMTIGVKIRDRIPARLLRTLATASCFILGASAIRDAVALYFI